MGNDAYIMAGTEIVKMLIMLAFQVARRENMTQDEIEVAYQEALMKFLGNDPNKIPDV